MMKIFSKHTCNGFLLAFTVSIITVDIQQSFTYTLRDVVAMGVILGPIMTFLFYSIKFAGMPLIKDFIEGNIWTKVLIISIIISAVIVKFNSYL